MGFKVVTDDKKQKLIAKVEAMAAEKGVSPHAAATALGTATRSKYYSYKKSLGVSTLAASSSEAINIHPETKRQYAKRERVTRAVLVYGSLKELAQFAREVESA